MCRDLDMQKLKGVFFGHSCGLDQYILNRASSGEVGPKSKTNVLSSIHEYDENVFWYWKLEEKRCNLTKQFVDIFHHQSVCC